jgi:hypothetical protein
LARASASFAKALLAARQFVRPADHPGRRPGPHLPVNRAEIAQQRPPSDGPTQCIGSIPCVSAVRNTLVQTPRPKRRAARISLAWRVENVACRRHMSSRTLTAYVSHFLAGTNRVRSDLPVDAWANRLRASVRALQGDVVRVRLTGAPAQHCETGRPSSDSGR